MNAGHRIIAAVVAGALAVSGCSGCSEYQKLRKGVDQLSHPDSGPRPLTDEQKIKLIDSMRAKGSFEAARDRLTGSAQAIAEQISTAVPGQTWKFADDPNERDAYQNGSLCDDLDPDLARRPRARTVEFGATFNTDGFTAAVGVVRQEAVKYGATQQSSLFNEPTKRDYDVQGDGNEFNLGQAKIATLLITGDCFLFQKVLDTPPGQFPGR
ncbi:LppA family lipoprotein [Mycobacterium sp.]|uniref:LppA family lipoprotein n=1 Tax=Mycobacterium sp. TaxID=1785 RepID=UPI003D10F393